MDTIQYRQPPRPLRNPLLVVGFSAPGTATAAGVIAVLLQGREPNVLAEFESEEFFDFTVARPFVRLVDDERVLDWPDVRFYHLELPERDVVLLGGPEPHLRWKTFAAATADFAARYGIQDVVLLSSFTGATPHTRPAPLQWFPLSRGEAGEPVERFGLPASYPRYQGPATFTMVLATALRDAGLTVGALNAVAPFYIGLEPSPHAMRVLAATLGDHLGIAVDLSPVDGQIAEVERQAAEQMRQEGSIGTFVQDLEEQYDEAQGRVPDLFDTAEGARPEPEPLPDSDSIVAGVEELLRQHRGGSGKRAA